MKITSYDTLPIGKYMQILSLDEGKQDELSLQVSMVAILDDLTPDAVMDMPLEEYRSRIAELDFLKAPLLGPDGRTPHDGRRVPDAFTVGPFRLRLEKDVRKMTVAQYIDFQTFSKEVTHLPELLSCVLIPEGCIYNEGYDILLVQDALRRLMPCTEAGAIAAFFLRNYAKSIRDLLTSSTVAAMRTPRKKRTPEQEKTLREARGLIGFLRSGDGLRTLMRSLSSSEAAGAPSIK